MIKALGQLPNRKDVDEKNPKRYQDPVLWVWFEIFSSLRGTNTKTTHYSRTLKGTTKAPDLRGTKAA